MSRHGITPPAIFHGIRDTSFYEDQTKAPTLFLVREYLRKKRLGGRMGLWKASAMRILESLCFKHGLGPVMNSEEWNHRDLLNHGVVLELDALADADKVFLAEALILWIYEYRKNQAQREVFKHALIIEEAHHILSQAKEKKAGTETTMETCLRQIREFGEAVIAIDQEPTKLSESIKANTNTKIVFNLGNGKDIQDISRALSLTPEESRCQGLLQVGAAIVTIQGRASRQLHVHFPKIPVDKGRVAHLA